MLDASADTIVTSFGLQIPDGPFSREETEAAALSGLPPGLIRKLRVVLERYCGVMSAATGKLCANTKNCSLHSPSQRASLRAWLFEGVPIESSAHDPMAYKKARGVEIKIQRAKDRGGTSGVKRKQHMVGGPDASYHGVGIGLAHARAGLSRASSASTAHDLVRGRGAPRAVPRAVGPSAPQDDDGDGFIAGDV